MSQKSLHSRRVADHFSGMTSYWKDIYHAPIGREDFYHHAAVIKRKAAILGFVDAFARGRSLRILDCGCGAGVIMHALLQRGHTVIGIDVSPEMVAEARKALSDVPGGKAEACIGTVEALEFENEGFDVCLCVGVLQYLREDRRAIRELSRVTKPGGHVIITIPNIARVTTLLDPYYYIARGPLFVAYKVLNRKVRATESASRDIHENLSFRNRRYYYRQLDTLLKRSRLSVHGIHPIGYGPLTFWQRELLPKEVTLRASRYIERAAMSGPFSFLKALADRWVFDLEKTRI